MNWNTIDQRCESTPFKLIDLGTRYWIELYWSKRAGTYGYQVYAAWVDRKHAPVYSDSGEPMYHEAQAYFYKTDGFGYSKEDAALEHVLRAIGKKPADMHVGSESIPHKYRISGNYYRVPQAKLRVCK